MNTNCEIYKVILKKDETKISFFLNEDILYKLEKLSKKEQARTGFELIRQCFEAHIK